LVDLGFDRQQATEAYFACEKNQDLAANYLLNSDAPLDKANAISTIPTSSLCVSDSKQQPCDDDAFGVSTASTTKATASELSIAAMTQTHATSTPTNSLSAATVASLPESSVRPVVTSGVPTAVIQSPLPESGPSHVEPLTVEQGLDQRARDN